MLGKAQNNKTVGVDSLPNEVLKNNASCGIIKCLFNKIFVIHVIPSAWKGAIIKPISKNSHVLNIYLHCQPYLKIKNPKINQHSYLS